MHLNSVVAVGLLSIAGVQAAKVSPNARCGKQFGGYTCQGSNWGNCCSQYGYCGSTVDYCDAKTCQKGFGTCWGSPAAPSVRTTLTTSTKPASTAPDSPATCSASTVTLSGSVTTITSILTAPGEEVTSISTLTVPGEGEVITVTEPTTISTTVFTTEYTTIPTTIETTITLPTTVTLPGEEIFVTESVTTVLTEQFTSISTIVESITTTIIEPTTVTATSIQATTATTNVPACPTGNPVVNSDFQSGGLAPWVSFLSSNSPSSGMAPVSDPEAPGGIALYAVTGAIEIMRAAQAISVCPGTSYQVSFVARRNQSTDGRVSVYLTVNGARIAGGLIQGNTYAGVVPGTWTVPANTYVALIAVEVTFEGPGFKNVLVDSIAFTPQGIAS